MDVAAHTQRMEIAGRGRAFQPWMGHPRFVAVSDYAWEIFRLRFPSLNINAGCGRPLRHDTVCRCGAGGDGIGVSRHALIWKKILF
jgi:hypothetical protein